MRFIEMFKAKPKKDSTIPIEVDTRVISAIITENQLSKEYLDKTDTPSLLGANKHVVYIAINKNSTVMSMNGFKLISKKRPSARSVKFRELGVYEKAVLKTKHAKAIGQSEDLVEITEHPFLDLMKQVNPLTSYSEFLYGDNTYMDLLGNSFWYIEKNQVGTPVGLYLLPAQDMKIKPSNKLFIEKYMMKNGDNLIEFAPDEIIHRKRFDPANQFFGMSPLAACESVYNMREYMDRYELHLYANDGRPSGIITTDEKVIGTSGWEDTRELLRREMAGLSNTGKIALLDRGFDYKRISVSPKDLESLEGRKATASEIRNAFGQTDALYESSANRSTSESADYAFRKDAVAPRLKFLEDDINKQLLPLFDENLVLVFDNPVPVDIEKQAKQLKEFVTNTILTPNEARHAIGYGPHESILADELLIPVNLASVSQAYMQNQANGEEGKKEDD